MEILPFQFVSAYPSIVVITGLVPVIHLGGGMDCPDEPGNDEGEG